jgi:sugar phosphate isomerase/epimerase
LEIGIFAKTFPRSGLDETLDAVSGHGLTQVQFNMACAGMATLPERFDPDVCDRIAAAFAARRLTMAAVSGTFNMAHPDPVVRRAGLDALHPLALSCTLMGTSVITLCTGTRDPDDMWRHHPGNATTAAWRDLTGCLREALAVASGYGVTLAFEPEVDNVVDSALRARRLLDEMASPGLKVVIDPANLFHAGELPRMREILEEAFDLLGGEIVLAHAKDLDRDGGAGHEAAGTGRLDYDLYLDLLRGSGYRGPLILHGLREDQVAASVAFVRAKLAGPPRGS